MKKQKVCNELIGLKPTHPIMNLPDEYTIFDFLQGYNPEKMADFTESGGWGVGGYLENRSNMYTAPQYENRRKIHMGIDIWAKVGEPVFAPLPGTVAYTGYHGEEGNYGGTIVLKHHIAGEELFALYGHLSKNSLDQTRTSVKLEPGDIVGYLGNPDENGNWPPHLHYQLSIVDPGVADMPGVVSEDEAERASGIYPDPRIILGPIY